MKKNHVHIVLMQPEIPQNTGAIARLAAATASRLHLIEPLGYELSAKTVRRAGLDYWPFLDLEVHSCFKDFLVHYPEAKMGFLSKFSNNSYTEMKSDVDTLVFGRETKGLPDSIHNEYSESLFKIPMFHSGVRSLNLATAVSLVCYHQMNNRSLLT